MTNEPLTPPDCDLRDFPYMPLDVVRLRDSDISALSTGDEFRCAVLLWCTSWHQVPAASLPNDDLVLSQFAGFGRVVKEWKKIKAGALRGWILCADGRYYHPVVAEKANTAWAEKLKYAHKKMSERLRKSGVDKDDIPSFDEWISAGMPVDFGKEKKEIPPEKKEIPPENSLKGKGEGKGKGYIKDDDKSSSSRSRSRDDDQIPNSPIAWVEIFAEEYGVEIDHRSVHDRKKFWPIAAAWVSAGVTRGQMRDAVATAQAESREPIAFLPAYVDRVIACLKAPKKPAAESFRERDEAARRKAWEDRHGRPWPESGKTDDRRTIDVTPKFLEIEQ